MLKHLPFYGSLVGKELYKEETAKTSHVLIYGAVEAHSMGSRGCIASNKTIAIETGLKESTVSKSLSQLNKAGWVNVVLDKNRNRKQIAPLLEVLLPSKGGLTQEKGGSYSPVNIEDSNKNTVLDFPEGKKTPQSYGDERINQIVDYWKETTKLPVTKVRNQRYAVATLLKTYSVDELKGLIDLVSYSHNDKYASKQVAVSSLRDLGYNHQQVLVYAKKQQGNKKREILS